MNNKSNADRNLLKLKVALATGGLMATLIGAGLLGKEASTLTADSSTNIDMEVVTATNIKANTTNTNTVDTIDITVPETLNLNLEAIPTVAAPTISSNNNNSSSSSISSNGSTLSMPAARGHSSG